MRGSGPPCGTRLLPHLIWLTNDFNPVGIQHGCVSVQLLKNPTWFRPTCGCWRAVQDVSYQRFSTCTPDLDTHCVFIPSFSRARFIDTVPVRGMQAKEKK